MQKIKKNTFEYLYNYYALQMLNRKFGFSKKYYIDRHGHINYTNNPIYDTDDIYCVLKQEQQSIKYLFNKSEQIRTIAQKEVISQLTLPERIELSINAFKFSKFEFINILKLIQTFN